MKKSKIIVPALLILTLSTAAAVTGTVAWFTGSRLVTISASSITAFDPEEGLKVTLAAGAHTSVTTAVGQSSTAAAVTIGGLRDASVDMTTATPTVYKAVLNAEGTAPASFAAVSSPYNAQTIKVNNVDTQLGYAATYTATFALTEGASNQNYNLIYDHTKMVATNTGSQAIAPGLRIGIKTSSAYVVIAPFKASGDLEYVSGTTTDDVSTYSSNVFRSATTGNQQIATGLTGTGTIVATVFTWFEGTDAATISTNVDSSKSLSVSLGFRIEPAA